MGSDGGVYRSADHSSTFLDLNGDINDTQFYPGISGRLSSAPLTGGLQDNGSVRWNGTGWSLSGGGDGGYSAVLANGAVTVNTWYGDHIVKTMSSSGYCSSIYDSTGINTRDAQAMIWPMVKAANVDVLWAGTSRVYRSTTGAAACGSTSWRRR